MVTTTIGEAAEAETDTLTAKVDKQDLVVLAAVVPVVKLMVVMLQVVVNL
jgi:hypothetical protein